MNIRKLAVKADQEKYC